MKKRRKKLRKESPQAEALLWAQLRNKRLYGYKFRRQYSVGNYIVDFYCPKLKLAIEVDGPSHIGREEYDYQRQKYIEQFGIRFLRFRNEDVYENMRGVIERICREFL